MQTKHAEGVLAVYQEGIDTGISTFETVCPDWNGWDKKYHKHPRLVIESHLGMVAGWAALSAVSSRQAYAGVAEVSIYIGAAHRGHGLGTQLLEALVPAAEEAGFWTIQAVVLAGNIASMRIHERAGFRLVGYREKIAKRNGEWLDSFLYEKRSALF